jgi:hypothetical protein
MSRKTIAICFIVGVVIAIIGAILEGSAMAATITAAATGGAPQAPNMPLLIVSFILLAVGSILGLISWIGTLINLARLRRWVWFVLTIFFSGISIIVYLIVNPQPADGM